jgi:hypothetical protein
MYFALPVMAQRSIVCLSGARTGAWSSMKKTESFWARSWVFALETQAKEIATAIATSSQADSLGWLM